MNQSKIFPIDKGGSVFFFEVPKSSMTFEVASALCRKYGYTKFQLFGEMPDPYQKLGHVFLVNGKMPSDFDFNGEVFKEIEK